MDVGGLERVALDLCRQVDPGEFESRILCVREAGSLAPLAREHGIEVEALGARGWLLGTLRVARRLRRLRPHVLHTHNPGSHRVGVPARLLARVPVLVHTKHGRNNPGDARAVASNRRLARFSDVVVAVSRDAAEVATSLERIPESKVRVIHNGIELGECLPASAWDRWPPRAITVARLDPVKDQATMLRGLRRAVDARPDLQLEIVGDGPSRESLERLVGELRLGANVSFAGYRRDVASLLLRPQVFLLSSVSEGIALTLLEAMAAGLPAVVTDVGGNREVVEPGVSGLLVPAGQPDLLGEQLLSLLGDAAKSRAFGAAGRARVERDFDLRDTAARYRALYEQLIAERAAG